MEKKCGNCCGTGKDCTETVRTCAAGVSGCMNQCAGGGNCAVRAESCSAESSCQGNGFVWDYDDTVLVFSSDMLEEEDQSTGS